MKFSEFDDFVNNQMNLQGEDKNFQQVVISTLIQNGGKATINELKEQVLKYHPDSNFDIGHASIGIITNPVSRKQKVLYNGQTIAKRTSDTIEILDYDTYTIEEKAKLIVDCILRIPEKKEYLEDSIDYVNYKLKHQTELIPEKEETLKKYSKIFNLKNIDKLTESQFLEFLDIKHNKHWDGIQRNGTTLTKKLKELKDTLKILVDESKPLEERITKSIELPFFGLPVFTPILLISSKLKHAVVNAKILNNDDTGALNLLGLITNKQCKKLGEVQSIILSQKMIEYISNKYNIDLWHIDWVWWDLVNKRQPHDEPRYWLMMPGNKESQDQLKPKWISEDYCAVGYRDLFLPKYFDRGGNTDKTNYQELKNKVERDLVKQEAKSAKKENRTPKKIVHQTISKAWIPLSWFMQIAKNDVVYLWNGADKIFARGEVGDGHYEYKKETTDHHIHRRKLTWIQDERDIPDGTKKAPAMGIFHLKDKNHEFFKLLTGIDSSTMSSPPTSTDYQEDLALLEWEKNLILYGPPGTGKTYHANKIAESLVESNTPSSSSFTFDPSKNYFMINGGWTNLGFSLSKKPFIWATQGTDPSTKGVWDKLQPGDIVFVSNSTKDSGPHFSDKVILGIGICLKKFKGTKPYWPDELKKNKVIYDHRFELELFMPHQSQAILFNSIKGLPYTKGFNAIANEENIKQLLNQISNNWTFQKPLIENIEKITFHQSFSYEEFIEGIKPEIVTDSKTQQKFIDYSVKPGIFKKFCTRAEADKQNKYVMIIDEINRGNISKIFGELITVIEKDKRGTTVTLPYSGETFSVSENVYVIGTMNTADRSIAKIDTALSRRFGRREIMPNSGVLDNKVVKGINLTELLDKLNGKIKDIHRDRQIGHSYLMDGDSAIDNISDLRLAFLYDIIPLLKELTFEDEKELKEIIGNHFIDFKTKNIKEKMSDDEFEKEMKSFLNSDPKENEPEEKGGDETDAEET